LPASRLHQPGFSWKDLASRAAISHQLLAEFWPMK
jgi:hypothetical protein